MRVRVSDERCLRPRLPGAVTDAGRRVVGLLEMEAPGERRYWLVHEVRYDGHICRYRIDGSAGEPEVGGGIWLSEEVVTSYRPFCHLILERLGLRRGERLPPLHRLPGLPPSRALTRRACRRGESIVLTALDSYLAADGGLWLEVASDDDANTGGWLPLAELPRAALRAEPMGTGPSAECGSRGAAATQRVLEARSSQAR